MQIRDWVIMAFLSAVLLVVQIVLAPIPNVELVSLLVIIYTLYYKKKVFFIIYTFALLEGLIYGFGLWWIMYLYVWSILAIVTILTGSNSSRTFWSIISGIFGLTFGALCSIPYFITGGWGTGIGYWITGIPFDLIHCVSNVLVAFFLFKPLYKVIGICSRQPRTMV